MNWTAQDEAKWAELDARRNAKLKRDEIRLCGIADWISIHLESAPKSLYNLMVMRAKELRDALEPYEDRATKQECSQSNQADDGWIKFEFEPGMFIPEGPVEARLINSHLTFKGEGEFIDWSKVDAYRPVK